MTDAIEGHSSPERPVSVARLIARKRELENAPGGASTAEAWAHASIARVQAENPDLPEENIGARGSWASWRGPALWSPVRSALPRGLSN